MAADGCEYTSTERKISEQACNVLNELRKKGQLTDVVLKVEDGQFEVHRAIMSASSPYFRALFTNGMDETDHREVFIPGISADMMGIIVEYAYTRDSNVTAENVERLLPAADQFHVLGLVKACSAYLQQQIDFDNVIGIRNFAKHYFCSSLERTCHKFLMENFVQVANHGTEILILPLQEFMDLLDSDELNVKNEEFTFDVIMRWISYDVNTRKEHIVKLLKCVRLGLLSKEFFVETVKKHPLIKENAACKPVVIETLKYLCDLNMGNMDNDPSHPLARPRVPHELMFVIGGWSGGSPTNVIETYDTRADKWIVVDFEEGEENVGPRAYHGCATVGQLIYVIGGFDGMSYFNSCRCFDPSIKKWNEIAPMNACRCYVSVAVHEGLIYAMGGFDGHVRQNTAERYTPRTNQWSLVAPMNHQRSDASATTCDSKIYICGGFNGQECLNNAEYYDPATNQWTLLPPMRNRRSGVGVISHDSRVYAIGGFNGITRMNNGERYDPTTNAWTVIAEMYSPRSNFGIEVIDDLIFTIGGFNGVTTIYNVECYDPIQDEWYDCMDMNLYRSALSACIVKGLPNVKDYIHKDREGKPDKNKGGRGGTPHGQHTQHHGQQQYGQQNQQHAQQQQQNQQNNPLQPAPPPPPPPPPPAHAQNQNNQQQNNHVRGFQIRGLQEQDQIQPQVVQQHQLQQQLHQQLHAQHQQLQQQQQVQAQQQQLHQQVQQQLLEQQQARDHGN